MGPGRWSFILIYCQLATGTSLSSSLLPLGILCHTDFLKEYASESLQSKVCTPKNCTVQSYGPWSEVDHYELWCIGHWNLSLLPPIPLGILCQWDFLKVYTWGRLQIERLQKIFAHYRVMAPETRLFSKNCKNWLQEPLPLAPLSPWGFYKTYLICKSIPGGVSKKKVAQKYEHI